MKITMRLYRQHDLDLLYLYMLDGFSIQTAIKSAIKALVKKTGERMSVPTQSPNGMVLPNYAQFQICLSATEDSDLIAWIRSITSGYRNALLKSVLRNYLEGPILEPYIYAKFIKFSRNAVQQTGKPKKTVSVSKTNAAIGNSPTFDTEARSIADEVIHAAPPSEVAGAKYRAADEVLQQNDTEGEFDMFDEFERIMNSY